MGKNTVSRKLAKELDVLLNAKVVKVDVDATGSRLTSNVERGENRNFKLHFDNGLVLSVEVENDYIDDSVCVALKGKDGREIFYGYTSSNRGGND